MKIVRVPRVDFKSRPSLSCLGYAEILWSDVEKDRVHAVWP